MLHIGMSLQKANRLCIVDEFTDHHPQMVENSDRSPAKTVKIPAYLFGIAGFLEMKNAAHPFSSTDPRSGIIPMHNHP